MAEILDHLSGFPPSGSDLRKQIDSVLNSSVAAHPGLLHAKLIGPIAVKERDDLQRQADQEAHRRNRDRRTVRWGESKQKILSRLADLQARWATSERELLSAVSMRVSAAAESQSKLPGARLLSLRLRLAGRIASRLGEPHPLESGFMFHPLLGIPYLPGSGFKGAVRFAYWARHVAETTGSSAADGQAEMRWLFGSADPPIGTPANSPRTVEVDVREHERGAAVFFDLLPGPGVRLQVDVVNPHFKQYYEGTRTGADDESPVPNYFLTAEGDATWGAFVAVVAKPGEPQFAYSRLESAIKDCLTGWGVGAKTAAGYGVFELQSDQPASGAIGHGGDTSPKPGAASRPPTLSSETVADSWKQKVGALKANEWGSLGGLLQEIERADLAAGEKDDRRRVLALHAADIWKSNKDRMKQLRKHPVLGPFMPPTG